MAYLLKYTRLPDAVAHTIAKMVQELLFADVLMEMRRRLLSQFGVVLFTMGIDCKLEVAQYHGEMIGQNIRIQGWIGDIGKIWCPYEEDWLSEWQENKHSLKQFHCYLDKTWECEYATKQTPSDMEDGMIDMILMIGSIPKTPEFAKFEALENDEYMMRYPGFIPVSVRVYRHNLTLEEVIIEDADNEIEE